MTYLRHPFQSPDKSPEHLYQASVSGRNDLWFVGLWWRCVVEENKELFATIDAWDNGQSMSISRETGLLANMAMFRQDLS
jgi:hypothetical protein